MATKYLISTTMGDSILDSGRDVYVEVSPSRFSKKNVTDVNIGDKVIFQKPYARTELEDVDPYLIRSPRYSFAKDKLLERNSKGDYVTSFRKMLLKGLSDHGVISGTALDERSLFETEDFYKEDYDEMEEYLSDILERNGKKRSRQAIGNWLRGETIV